MLIVELWCEADERTAREGTPGRYEPPLCRHEPPRFARQTAPPLCRPCLRYAVNEPPPYSIAFYKSWFLCVIKNVNNFFLIRNIYGLIKWFIRFILKL